MVYGLESQKHGFIFNAEGVETGHRLHTGKTNLQGTSSIHEDDLILSTSCLLWERFLFPRSLGQGARKQSVYRHP